jgi:hypothetical protein
MALPGHDLVYRNSLQLLKFLIMKGINRIRMDRNEFLVRFLIAEASPVSPQQKREYLRHSGLLLALSNSDTLKKVTFRKLDMFSASGETVGNTYSVGSVRKS